MMMMRAVRGWRSNGLLSIFWLLLLESCYLRSCINSSCSFFLTSLGSCPYIPPTFAAYSVGRKKREREGKKKKRFELFLSRYYRLSCCCWNVEVLGKLTSWCGCRSTNRHHACNPPPFLLIPLFLHFTCPLSSSRFQLRNQKKKKN